MKASLRLREIVENHLKVDTRINEIAKALQKCAEENSLVPLGFELDCLSSAGLTKFSGRVDSVAYFDLNEQGKALYRQLKEEGFYDNHQNLG